MWPATFGRSHRPRFAGLWVTALAFLISMQVLKSQQPQENQSKKCFIERVEITGNRRIESTTILDRIFSRPGDPYDSEAVHRDVQALRDTGYFEQVRLRVEDSPDRPNGKIIAFDVKEKPIVRRIEYRGIGSITESDVVHAFKEHRITLSEGSQFDERELRRAATVIQELLSKRGRPSAVVKPTYEINRNANVAIILFTIDERPNA